MRAFNPLAWKRSRLLTGLVLVAMAAVAGAATGYHHAWSIISAEDLDPADPYIPTIYEKFAAAGAVGVAGMAALALYLFEVMRSRRS